MRKAAVKRKTKETDVEVEVDLDGQGRSQVASGIGFLDHMLDLLPRHSRTDIPSSWATCISTTTTPPGTSASRSAAR